MVICVTQGQSRAFRAGTCYLFPGIVARTKMTSIDKLKNWDGVTSHMTSEWKPSRRAFIRFHTCQKQYAYPCAFFFFVKSSFASYCIPKKYEVSGERRLNSFDEARRCFPDSPPIVMLLKNADSLNIQYVVIVKQI